MKPRQKLKAVWHNDWIAVKALRKFVDGFEAQAGYHLDDVHEGRLSSAKKAKIRRYIDKYRSEIVAINSGKYTLRHYRNRDTLRDAVAVSQQETPLESEQRNAVFYTADPKNFKVRVRRGRGFEGESRFVLQDGLFTMDRIRFDNPDFLATLQDYYNYFREQQGLKPKKIRSWKDVLADQPELLVDAARALLPEGKRFSMLTGKYSTEPVREQDFLSYFRNKMMQYLDEDTGELLHEIDFIKGIQALDAPQSERVVRARTKRKTKRKQKRKTKRKTKRKPKTKRGR